MSALIQRSRNAPGNGQSPPEHRADEIADNVTVKLLKRRGFDRYLARRQAYFDIRVCSFGTVIYAATAFALAQNGAPPGAYLTPLVLGLACLGPPAMGIFAPEAYYRWRNWIFVSHFYIHHVCAPAMLLRFGMDMPQRLPPHLIQGNRLMFFLSLTFFRTMLWQSLNVLMYRIRVGIYWFVQPLILLAAAPHELGVCAWAVDKYPKETAAVYGDVITGARLLAALLHPIIPPLLGPDLDPLTACRRIHSFLLFFVVFLVPGIIIWRLEWHVWREFLSADVGAVAWPGGPPPAALRAAQQVLREEEQSRRSSFVDAGRAQVAAAAAAAAVIWWTASDFFI